MTGRAAHAFLFVTVEGSPTARHPDIPTSQHPEIPTSRHPTSDDHVLVLRGLTTSMPLPWFLGRTMGRRLV